MDNFFHQLNTPAGERVQHIIFGLKLNLKQALLIRQPNTHHEIVILILKTFITVHDTLDELVVVLKELKNHQFLRPKEENITAPNTSH